MSMQKVDVVFCDECYSHFIVDRVNGVEYSRSEAGFVVCGDDDYCGSCYNHLVMFTDPAPVKLAGIFAPSKDTTTERKP